jgi:FtsP/CotA-like multicopper oxidase with cupredoxin domain
VIAINGELPGPRIAAKTNDVVEVNVFNRLDEPLLFTWFAPIPASLHSFITRARLRFMSSIELV